MGLRTKTAESLPAATIEDFLREVSRLVRKPVRDSDPAHTLFSYPAKFQAAVPSYLIEKLTLPRDLVLDPFGGGGTSAACAQQLGRPFVHYDLSPFSCLVASAKTAAVAKKDRERALALLNAPAPSRRSSLLSAEEKMLLGPEVSLAFAHGWGVVKKLRGQNEDLAAIVAVVLAKLVKVCGRRDSGKRREQKARKHVDYVAAQVRKYCEYLERHPAHSGPRLAERRKIRCASNHELRLRNRSVDLIVTSPPYPGVDIEYAQIQLQRRDLKRCYRSDLPLRMAQEFFPGPTPTKKQLCNGGENSYFANAEKSLLEMRRVLRRGRLAFVYCGFKTELDQKRYEAAVKRAGFRIRHQSTVLLSGDRVASSRSTHHGKDTNLMQRDILFVLV